MKAIFFYIPACILVDLAAAVFFVRRSFPESGSFLDALKYWFQPWWLSMLRGEWGEDIRKSLKLTLALVPTIILVVLESLLWSVFP